MKYFGTDGFRGEAGINLTSDHAYKIGRFLGWYYSRLNDQAEAEGRIRKDGPVRVVIGKDTRRSSYMLEYSLVGGLVASGADAYLMHVTTTPSISYITRVDHFDCGVMITASHNPFYDNGIKILNEQGEKMDDGTIGLIEDYIDGELEVFGQKWPELPFATKEKIGCTVDYIAGRNRYVAYLISLGIYDFRGVRVGLDCSNGASWSIARAVFSALGADVHVIHDSPDGFNINRNCGSTHIEELQQYVLDNHLDVGFAFDGDADRCLAVDEKGNIITGDHIIHMYGNYMKERGKLLTNTVVVTKQSNYGLFKALREEGIDAAITDVGDRFVYEYMREHGCRIGGEQSGHIIFSKYATTGDGLLTSLKIMQVMLAKKKPLSELAALTMYPEVQLSIRVQDKAEALASPELKAKIEEVEAKLDGNGRVLVRPSGTEPVVRVLVETMDPQKAQEYADAIAACLK